MAVEDAGRSKFLEGVTASFEFASELRDMRDEKGEMLISWPAALDMLQELLDAVSRVWREELLC